MSSLPDDQPGGRALRHFAGLVLFPVIGLAVAVVWLVFVTRTLGVGRDGFGVAGVLIVIPLYSAAFGLLVWLPLWWVYDRKWGEMSPRKAVLIGLAAGFVLAILLTGYRSFGPAPGAQFFGWAILAVTTSGGWAYNKILNR